MDDVGSVGETRRLQTSEMSYGPHAVARLDGKAIFVRGGAPHETVDVVIREEHPRYSFAEVVAVVEPATVRREPPCRYLPRCGGCPWQHLVYAAQLEAKRNLVHEHLRRIGGLDLEVAPVMPSPSDLGYRQRLKLRVQRRALGFVAGGTHDLVAVDECLLAVPAISTAIPAVAAIVSRLKTAVQRIEIALATPDGKALVVAAQCEGSWVATDEVICRQWLDERQSVRGLVLAGRRWRQQFGVDDVSILPEADLPLSIAAGTFSQVNSAANQLLVGTVLRLANPQPGLQVVDLYSGAGNLSLPLARRGANVWAVEQQQQAVRDGRRNAARLGLPNCRFVAKSAVQALVALRRELTGVDVVVLDPPRSGAAEVMKPLLELAPKRIIYVSCNPTTMARDLKALAPRYRFDLVQPIDLFPHSYHVETVVGATLTC